MGCFHPGCGLDARRRRHHTNEAGEAGFHAPARSVTNGMSRPTRRYAGHIGTGMIQSILLNGLLLPQPEVLRVFTAALRCSSVTVRHVFSWCGGMNL
jgi:hypothetical protein